MVKKYKIVLNQNNCMGCGACACMNSKYYKMGKNGKSNLINSKQEDNKDILILEEDYDVNKETIDCCPVNCIHLFEDL